MRKYKFIKNSPELNGQSQCYGCKQKGIWNVSWSCMMWTYTKDHHHYCDKCKKEIEEKIEIGKDIAKSFENISKNFLGKKPYKFCISARNCNKIKELYIIIKSKRDNAVNEYINYDPRNTIRDELKGQTNAYNDIMSLMEKMFEVEINEK